MIIYHNTSDWAASANFKCVRPARDRSFVVRGPGAYEVNPWAFVGGLTKIRGSLWSLVEPALPSIKSPPNHTFFGTRMLTCHIESDPRVIARSIVCKTTRFPFLFFPCNGNVIFFQDYHKPHSSGRVHGW
jgi:hypothetical protein